jgi:hypothetical protein
MGLETGTNFSMPGHDDLRHFRRFRRCEACDDEFETYEIEEKFLHELVRLRAVVEEFELAREEQTRHVNKALKELRAVKKHLTKSSPASDPLDVFLVGEGLEGSSVTVA